MSARFHLPAVARQLIAARLAKPAALSSISRTRRACLYKVDRLGDFVLALGALHRLVGHYGASECRLVVSSVAAPIAAAEFPGVERWELPPDASGVWREMWPLRHAHAARWAAEDFGELVCLRHARSTYRDIALGWIHAKQWRGLGPRPNERSVFAGPLPEFVAEYPPQARPGWCRELLAHGEVVARVTGTAPDWPALRPRLRSVSVTAGGAWVFCPFGNEPNRDFPEDGWILAWRSAEIPAGPVQVIGPAARAEGLGRLARRLRQEANRADVAVAMNLPSLDFVARLAQARGIITVDSAAAQFAAAFDKPAVILMGGGHFGCFAPWGDGVRQRWLFTKMPCFGCGWDCQFSSVRCLVDQPVESVARALREMMN